MIDPDVNRPQQVETPDECLKVDYGNDNSDPWEGQLILDKPILCFYEKHRCPDGKDFERRNLDEAMDRFSGFADYIYWIEEARVEDSRRM